MKKILALSLLTIGLIAADIPLKINGKIVMERHPLPFNVLSQESGGSMSAIDAYSDGVGVMLVDKPTGGVQIDNSGLNSLVYKYGEAAKSLGAPLKDYVLTNISDPVDRDIAEKLFDARIDGTECDDGNEKTINDIWNSGICSGQCIPLNEFYVSNIPANQVKEVEMWVKSVRSDIDWTTFFQAQNEELVNGTIFVSNRFYSYFRNSDKAFRSALGTNSAWSNIYNVNLNDNTFRHLKSVLNGSTLKSYINGVEVNSITNNEGVTSNPLYFRGTDFVSKDIIVTKFDGQKINISETYCK